MAGGIAGRNSAVRVRVRALVRAAEARHKERKRQLRMQGKLGSGLPLPPELVSCILGRLAVRYLCRASAACKAWKEEVRSPDFVKEYNLHSLRRTDAPALALLSAHREQQPSVAFDTETKRWVPVPTLFFDTNNCRLVAQAKGLYVYNVTRLNNEDLRNGFPTQLVVSNPMTGATKWLPPMLNHTNRGGEAKSAVLLEIAHDSEGAAYKITCVDVHIPCMEVYDSRSASWNTLVTEPLNWSFRYLVGCYACSQGVVLLGNVYFVTCAFGFDWGEVGLLTGRNRTGFRTIVSFKLKDRRWRVLCDLPEATAGPREQFPLRLVTCDDKLIVVLLKGCTKEGGGSIFVLDTESDLLVHETSLPRKLVSRLYSAEFGIHPILGQGRYLCSFHPIHGTMVAYDFHTKRWEEWPASPLPHLPCQRDDSLVDLQFGVLPLP